MTIVHRQIQDGFRFVVWDPSHWCGVGSITLLGTHPREVLYSSFAALLYGQNMIYTECVFFF